jgi:hypothetical protein
MPRRYQLGVTVFWVSMYIIMHFMSSLPGVISTYFLSSYLLESSNVAGLFLERVPKTLSEKRGIIVEESKL